MLPLLFLHAQAQESALVSQTTDTINVDGKLDEKSWESAQPITEFIQYIPTEGGIPSGKTNVLFLQDEKNLYIGIEVSQTDYRPQATITPREQINDDDQIGIYIDTVGDARTGYIFYFNPYGIQQDIRYSNGAWFVEWNTVYHSKGIPTKDGFTIEIAIPFRSLRYPETDTPDWRIMVTRKNPAKGSKYGWPKLKRTHPRMFVQAKPLKGIAPAPKGAGISLQPTLSAVHNMEDDNGSLIASPIDGWHERIRPSFDLRWGLNSDTGVAATINPDFSQIEGDVRQLNLNQRFAFFYPERRPFFLNNIGIFTDRASTLYSRSIVDPIYGVKFSGRDGERDFGVLQALDRTPNPSVHEQATDGFTEDALQDKLAWNNILRLRQDISKQGFVGITMADKRIFDQDASPTGAFSDTINAEVSLPFAQSWVGSVYSATSYAGLDDPKLGNQTSFSLSNSPAKGLGGYINALNSTSDYRQEMGFVTRSGLQSASGGLSYGIPLEGRSFSTSGLSGNFWKEESGNQLIRGNLEQNLRLHGIHSFGVRISPTYIQFSTAENLGYEANASWDSRFSSQVRTSINASHGTTIDYDQLIPAEYSTINASGVLRLTRSTNFYSTLSYNRFVPEGQDSSYALNSYNRFMWQLSRDWGMRIVHQSTVYSYQDPLHNGSLLLTWLTTPGTEAYIGGTWNFDKDAVQNLTIFAKFTRLFRL